MPTDPNQRATTVKNQDNIETRVACWEDSENKLKILKLFLETKTVAPITLTQTAMPTIKIITTTTTKTVKKPRESQKLFIHPVRHVEKLTTPQKNATLEQMQPIDSLPSTENHKDRIRSQRKTIKATLLKLLKLQPKIWTKRAKFSLRSCDSQTGYN